MPPRAGWRAGWGSRLLAFVDRLVGAAVGGLLGRDAGAIEPHSHLLERRDDLGIEIGGDQVLARHGEMLAVGGTDLHGPSVAIGPVGRKGAGAFLSDPPRLDLLYSRRPAGRHRTEG